MLNESQQMAVRQALIQVTNQPGWFYVKQLANTLVQKTVQEALDEDDRDLGESKRLKAKALQKGFTELFQDIENRKQFDPSIADDSGFGELEFDTEQN